MSFPKPLDTLFHSVQTSFLSQENPSGWGWRTGSSCLRLASLPGSGLPHRMFKGRKAAAAGPCCPLGLPCRREVCCPAGGRKRQALSPKATIIWFPFHPWTLTSPGFLKNRGLAPMVLFYDCCFVFQAYFSRGKAFKGSESPWVLSVLPAEKPKL